jgi:hypothetical protein
MASTIEDAEPELEWRKWIDSEQGSACMKRLLKLQRQLPLHNRLTPAYFENLLRQAFLAGYTTGAGERFLGPYPET